MVVSAVRYIIVIKNEHARTRTLYPRVILFLCAKTVRTTTIIRQGSIVNPVRRIKTILGRVVNRKPVCERVQHVPDDEAYSSLQEIFPIYSNFSFRRTLDSYIHVISVENTYACPIFVFGLGWVFYSSCKVNKEEVVDTNGERTSFSFSWSGVVRGAGARRSAYVRARFVSPLMRFPTDFIAPEGRLKSW